MFHVTNYKSIIIWNIKVIQDEGLRLLLQIFFLILLGKQKVFCIFSLSYVPHRVVFLFFIIVSSSFVLSLVLLHISDVNL